MITKNILAVTVATLAIAASASAMEMSASTTMMMKHDDAMIKTDATMMMKKDDGAMMMKKEERVMAREVEITALQEVLIEKGYLVIPSGVNKGTFGPRTRAALKRMQKENGLPATGFFGAMTKAKIAHRESVMMMKAEGSMMKKDGAMMKASSTEGAMMHN